MTLGCKQCDKEGLRILVARYALTIDKKVFPRVFPKQMPLPKSQDVLLEGKPVEYTARLLREGYLYVLDTVGGKITPYVYRVTKKGACRLININDPEANIIKEENSHEVCLNEIGKYSQSLVVSLPKPNQSRDVYFSYSPFKWSKNVYFSHLNNNSTRDAHMVKCSVGGAVPQVTYPEVFMNNTVSSINMLEYIADFKIRDLVLSGKLEKDKAELYFNWSCSNQIITRHDTKSIKKHILYNSSMAGIVLVPDPIGLHQDIDGLTFAYNQFTQKIARPYASYMLTKSLEVQFTSQKNGREIWNLHSQYLKTRDHNSWYASEFGAKGDKQLKIYNTLEKIKRGCEDKYFDNYMKYNFDRTSYVDSEKYILAAIAIIGRYSIQIPRVSAYYANKIIEYKNIENNWLARCFTLNHDKPTKLIDKKALLLNQKGSTLNEISVNAIPNFINTTGQNSWSSLAGAVLDEEFKKQAKSLFNLISVLSNQLATAVGLYVARMLNNKAPMLLNVLIIKGLLGDKIPLVLRSTGTVAEGLKLIEDQRRKINQAYTGVMGAKTKKSMNNLLPLSQELKDELKPLNSKCTTHTILMVEMSDKATINGLIGGKNVLNLADTQKVWNTAHASAVNGSSIKLPSFVFVLQVVSLGFYYTDFAKDKMPEKSQKFIASSLATAAALSDIFNKVFQKKIKEAVIAVSNSSLKLGMTMTRWAGLGLSLIAAGIFGYWDFRNAQDAYIRGNDLAGVLFRISAFTGVFSAIAFAISAFLIGFILISIFIVTQFLLTKYNTTKLQDWFKYSYFGRASKNWTFEQEMQEFDLVITQ